MICKKGFCRVGETIQRYNLFEKVRYLTIIRDITTTGARMESGATKSSHLQEQVTNSFKSFLIYFMA